MPRGGARRGAGRKKGTPRTPGSGRKKGIPNKTTIMAGKRLAEIMEKAAEKGVEPLEMMLDNMQFYRSAAAGLAAKIAKEEKPTASDFAEMIKLRQLAGESAKDAAPYMHRRLASLEVEGDIGLHLKTQEEAVADMERRREEARAARQQASAKT